MQTERTETERKMNDLAFLKEQMATIKADQATARRVDWMRRGTFQDDRKLGQLLNEGLKPLASAKPMTTKGSQLNVEVHRDGTVTGLRLLSRSGSYVFDQSCLGAVEAAARAGKFGPLPQGFTDDVLPVIFSFDPKRMR